jgi:hypothetical protein
MKIWTGNGPVVINVEDFNPDIHTRAADDDSGPAGDPVEGDGGTPTPPAPGGADSNDQPSTQQSPQNDDNAPAPLLVSKNGSKFFVVGQNGAAVEREGIEPKGYKTENDAWAAIMALNNA